MLNETWLAVKFKASKQQLQDVLDFKVKLIFGSPHPILNNHHHNFRRLKSNLKCFSINESHCIEHWSSHATNSTCLLLWVTLPVHVIFTDLVPPFLASTDHQWFEAFPYFKNLPNYGFVFGTKCLCRWENGSMTGMSQISEARTQNRPLATPATPYISLSPFRWSIQDSNKLCSFLPTRYPQFACKIFVHNHFSTE